MTWLAWRQFRVDALVATMLTVAIVVVLVLTHGDVAHVANSDAFPSWTKSLRLLGTGLIGVPAIIGAFWGAPLLAHEFETGTHRLVWTQSVTRRRWLTEKLVVVGLAAVVATGVFSVAFTWWSAHLDHFGNRIGTANFGQRGIVPIAYAVFALALGTLMGAMFRRTLPAMAVTIAGFIATRLAFQALVRPHLLATVTATLPNNVFGQRAQSDAAMSGGWILSTRTVDAAGHTVSGAQIDRLVRESCNVGRATTTADLGRCADRIGLHDVVRMHPARQFWALQGWEAAIFVGFAVVLVAACFWWVRHRAV